VSQSLTALRRARAWILAVLVLSFFVNLLMLTGPMYMLQVYDRVLASRSLDTLVALTALMGGLYLFMGIFDFGRSRILARYGLKWSETAQIAAKEGHLRADTMRDLLRDGDMVARAHAHPSMLGLLDVLWIPLFVIVLWLLHPLLAGATLVGLVISLVLAATSWWFGREPEDQAQTAAQRTGQLEMAMMRDASALEAIGGWQTAQTKWLESRAHQEDDGLIYQDTQGRWMTTIKTWRLFFQSAILGLGAYLAVIGALTPGAMIAGSILAGRALAPIDQLLSGVALLFKGRSAKQRLKAQFQSIAQKPAPTTPDFPTNTLEANAVAFQFPNQKPLLFNLSFKMEPGRCLAVMGESGAGKSVLARLAAGLWYPNGGSLTLDGIPLSHLAESVRRKTIGYVPQDPLLPEGRLIEVLKGFDLDIPDEQVMETARQLDLHSLFASLPQGYETPVNKGGHGLPMTVRRAALIVQAMTGAKKVLVLDDVCAGLSMPLILTLRNALKTFMTNGGSVILISDNVDILTLATHILVLDSGRTMAYGEGGKVVDTFIRAIDEGAAPARIPPALLPAIRHRKGKSEPKA
jgi:ABC-type protease/lipase transport system fused ATPase/permease subunit